MAKSNRPVVPLPADPAMTPATPQADPAMVAPAVDSDTQAFTSGVISRSEFRGLAAAETNAAREVARNEVTHALDALLSHAARRAAEIEPQQRDAVHLATARKWFVQWFKGINDARP